jgi:mRNA-degrading endonuclease RelE of RelBE toxin-antitoxin system
VLYKLEEDKVVILVLDVLHRKDAYKN